MKVVYLGMLQSALGVKEEEINPQAGSTVGSLLTSLANKYGESFRFTVLSRDGNLRPLVKVFVSDRDIAEMDGLNTKLEDNAEICIFIAVEAPAGG
jgi:molybdopterin converting factor small subunit